MSWTPIDADTSWQDLAICQQLAVAYNKRAASCAAAPQNYTIEQRLGVSSVDQAVTVFDFVAAMQIGLERIATQFANPATALSGLASVPSNYDTVADMMSGAGLTHAGYWRRIAEGGTQPAAWTDYADTGWSYGRITPKDLAGPWLFVDLQVALTHMTRRVLPIFARASAYMAEATATSYPTAYTYGDAFPIPSGNADMDPVDIDDKPTADLRVDKSAATGYAVTTCMTSVQKYAAHFYGAYSQFQSYRLVFIPSGMSTFSAVTGWSQSTLNLSRYVPCSLNTSGILAASLWGSGSAAPSWASIANELPDDEMDPSYPYGQEYKFMTITSPVVVLDYAFSPA